MQPLPPEVLHGVLAVAPGEAVLPGGDHGGRGRGSGGADPWGRATGGRIAVRISAFVITKDSARTLDRCPDSPDWASEVVVLDDFITDTGEEIWRWSRGRMFAQVLTELRFEPGESKRFEVQWDQRRADGTPAAAGHYQATGQIPTTLAGIPSAAETLSVR